MAGIAESTVESAALAWFEGLRYSVLNGPDIASGERLAERTNYADVVLAGRFVEGAAGWLDRPDQRDRQ